MFCTFLVVIYICVFHLACRHVLHVILHMSMGLSQHELWLVLYLHVICMEWYCIVLYGIVVSHRHITCWGVILFILLDGNIHAVKLLKVKFWVLAYNCMYCGMKWYCIVMYGIVLPHRDSTCWDVSVLAGGHRSNFYWLVVKMLKEIFLFPTLG